MSGWNEREMVESIINGLEAHDVNVTSEMRETLEERLTSGLANATRATGGRSKCDEQKPEYTEGYLDLWEGEFALAEGAAVVEHVARWPERERVIANGLCLAGVSGDSGLHICDIAMLWADWFKVAEGPSDLTRLWFPARSLIRGVLKRFGHDVQRVGELTWDVIPLEGANTGVTLSAKVAADDIRDARDALRSKNYEAASRHTLEAIDRCPVATAAHWLVAELSRSNLFKIDRARQLLSAQALLDRRRGLQLALDRLELMRSHGRRSMRRDWIPEYLERLAEELMATAPLGDWAQQTIDAAVNDQEVNYVRK